MFRGPIEALELCFFESGDVHQSTNLLWPEDRSWLIATDIDHDSTYVGGNDDLIDELLSCSALEIYSVDPEDRVSYDSDVLNPMSHPYGTTVSLKYHGPI